MIRATLRIIPIVFFLFHVDSVYSTDTEVGKPGPVESQAEAIEIVRQLVGHPIMGKPIEKPMIRSVQSIPTVGSQLAFIADEINQRSVWRVELDLNLQVLVPDSIDQGESYPKNLVVFIDSSSGLFLEARIYSVDGPQLKFRMPTAVEAEKQLNSFGEKYHGVPPEPAAVPMMSALDVCQGRPIAATETIISYVMYSYTRIVGDGPETYGPVSAWIVYTRGLSPISIKAPAFQTTNMRTVVNAETGERVLTNNLPYPELE